jgi:capsular polysaccharide export protein
MNKIKNILLIQGPMGGFFNKFAKYKKANNHKVFKINLNRGDKLFYRQGNATDYTGELDGFERCLTETIIKDSIREIYVFGDCRKYHKVAKKVAKRMRLDFYVFELGYIRPDYITLEKNGVNAYSDLPKNSKFYNDKKEFGINAVIPSYPSYMRMAVSASIYYFVNSLPFNKFNKYTHHKNPSYIREAYVGIRSLYRKYKYKITERKRTVEIYRRPSKTCFVVPIQVSTDFQIIEHSNYKSVGSFIENTVKSFSKYASEDDCLIIKHHPMDRGYVDYEGFINNLKRHYDIYDRVFYVHDIDLPTILKNAKGCVVVNSTVGLSSLHHKTPVKVMGSANYDFDGITYQGDLRSFWKDPGEVNIGLYRKYKEYLITETQINGSFYGLFPRFKKSITQQ